MIKRWRSIVGVSIVGVSLAMSLFSANAADQPKVPEWRGKAPGTAWLGPDMLWRCREGLVFHLFDEKGTGFNLAITIRDMNIYQQGPRPALLWVTGPDGVSVAKELVPDDGITKGGQEYCDGIADVYEDLRYREWHRVNSPGGYPPGKKRSPYLTNPEKLPARVVNLKVPPAGKGLYRLVVVAGWDYWLSITPSRPLAMGIHPGPGPLPIPQDRFKECYVYSPKNVKDFLVAIQEEVQPYSWTAKISDEKGKEVGEIIPKGAYNFFIVRKAKPDSVYQLSIDGKKPGAHLHMGGLPMVLCPDAETAKKIHGGVKVDEKGNSLFHGYQQTLVDWAKNLKKDELAVNVKVPNPKLTFRVSHKNLELGIVKKILKCQDLNPQSENYGQFVDVDKATGIETSYWFQPVNVIANVAGFNHPDNPYYGHPALIKRILLCRINKNLLKQTPYYWYGLGNEGPKEFKENPEVIWDLVLRSNWYPMHDSMHVNSLKPIRFAVNYALPAEIFKAWETGFQNWVLTRTNLQQGECSNQWAVGIKLMKDVWEASHDYLVESVLKRQIKRFTTPGILGRVCPDPTPYSKKSKVGEVWAADSGVIGGGVAADGLGHDGEYCLESTMHMNDVWKTFPDPGIEKWLNEYYVLKTHLTLPKGGGWPANTFSFTCSPTDINFRTRYYTHKTPLCPELRKKIGYGDIWGGKKNEQKPWPCMEKGSFVRNIDNRYYFVKTPNYYSIIYGGPVNHSFQSWGSGTVKGNSFQLTGYNGMHYGGFQRKPTKAGGISAVWVPGCGPTLLCQNHNVNFTNTVWGRLPKPVCETWEKKFVDPTVICSGFTHPEFDFDEKNRSYTKVEKLEHAPLIVTRKVKFNDQGIDVKVEIEATDDVEFKELYEGLPYFADNRKIKLWKGNSSRPVDFKIPKPVDTSGRKNYLGSPSTGEDASLPKLNFKAFEVTGKSGTGSKITLDKEYEFVQTRPIRYRSVASATGAFNLALKKKWKKGDKQTINYQIETIKK